MSKFQQIGRVRLPASTVCALCGASPVAAILEDGETRAYCAACMERVTQTQSLLDQLRPHTTAAHVREDGTIEAWLTFERKAGAYPLGWVVDPVGRRVRRLLDYDGWVLCEMTADGILSAVEVSEMAVTRRAWPAAAAYWCMGVRR